MSPATKPEVILAFPVDPVVPVRLREHYTVHYVPDRSEWKAAVASLGAGVQAVITNGMYGWTAELMDALPGLKIIAALGAGYENIDLGAARQRGIAVGYGRGTNTSSVADHAVALLLASVRGIAAGDRAVRAGEWASARGMRPDIFGARLGMLGLGEIGMAILERLSGFRLQVSYHNRHPRTDVDYRYAASPAELAAQVDFLVVATPGGAATRHIVDAAVLKALGPAGFLLNIGRGSAVDSDALALALREGAIAGAGLDVFEGEPALPPSLREAPNLVVTPHIAGASPGAYEAYVRSVVENIDARLAGKPLPHPVPDSPSIS
jgi:lactate dehydrogenase-like 2-hydroxyacid dehydrogenase